MKARRILRPGLGADRDVLQIRLGRRQPAGGGGRERVARMHALRFRIDIGRQRVGIGRAQFRHLPPVENRLRQLVALFGQVFERLGAGRPLPGLGLGAARQPHRSEQHVAELLRRAGIERLPGKLLDVRFEPHGFVAELARQFRAASAGRWQCRGLPCAPVLRPADAPAIRRRSSCARRRAGASACARAAG